MYKQLLHKALQTDLLLITPPFVQLNTPYPASTMLKGFLKKHNYNVEQYDLSIESILEIFSAAGLQNIFNEAQVNNCSTNAKMIFQNKNAYIRYIDAIIAFLQGKESSFAYAINKEILPKASRFEIQQDLNWHYGVNSVIDKAKFLATLFIEDIGDFITECIDSRFGFSRYAEQIVLNANNFETILAQIEVNTTITNTISNLINYKIRETNPKLIGFTVPFPGNFLIALKTAALIKQNYSKIPIVLGGGFINTELRNLSERRLFEFVDYVCIDDGELPLLKLLNHIIKGEKELSRTFMLENGKVTYINNAEENDFAHKDIGIQDYSGLPLNNYISVNETTNAMHNLWSNGRWNKMMLAHGCYWHNCSFCDTSLDYIKRYSSTKASVLCDRIEAIIIQTGQRGFHFIDEAAPPALLKQLAKELIARKIFINWWTNIRFEPSFNAETCQLLSSSGCIAVSGGLEVASNRLLEKMHKGVNVEQVIKVCAAFKNSGIMIHAYLMYDFPTQTIQETIDALEIVRQLFAKRLLNSAFWHRFTMTIHSPMGINPIGYNITPVPLNKDAFFQNTISHIENSNFNHQKCGKGLVKALYNYMHNNGIDYNLQTWFDFKIPNTKVPPNYVKSIIKNKAKPKMLNHKNGVL